MSDSHIVAESGHILGKPTLLATFTSKLDGRSVLSAITALGYPASDVRVYHRLAGTDQVLDALTGEVPAGEALTPGSVTASDAAKFDTLVLLHPGPEQFVAVKGALDGLGEADYKYSEATDFEGTGR